MSQSSSITLDPIRIPKYNGQLSPVHPANFLDKVDQYFLMHNTPDQVKINFVSDNFTGKALLWYITLFSPPLIYADRSQHKIPLFPLTGILLTTALSNKTVKIKSQIYLNFSIEDHQNFGIFLVASQLFISLILGTDWLLENSVTIDFNKKLVSMPFVKEPIPFKLITNHDPDSLIDSLQNINISEYYTLLLCMNNEYPSNLMYQSLPFETEKNLALNDIPLNAYQQNLMNL